LLNIAEVPVPFANPAAPLPAKVTTVPVVVINLIAEFPRSATNTSPLLSTATPLGSLKVTESAVLENPTLPLPAIVVTVPCGDIYRIALFCSSATNKNPSELIATPTGILNEACSFEPSDAPGAPVPAKVVTDEPPCVEIGGGVPGLFLLQAVRSNATAKDNVKDLFIFYIYLFKLTLVFFWTFRFQNKSIDINQFAKVIIAAQMFQWAFINIFETLHCQKYFAFYE
jgi:hypothetical protein